MAAEAPCPPEKVQVKSLSGGAYQAEGCGKTTTYDCSWPEGGKRTCTRRGVPPAATRPGTGWL